MTRMYSGNETMAGFTSLLIHAGVVAMILLLGTLKPVQQIMKSTVTLIAPSLKPYEASHSGGGGGGGRSPVEASKGKAPKSAPRVFTPPRVDPTDSKLPMVPTIIGDVPNITATNYGDPLGKMGTPSNGTGFGGGIGSGNGFGIGSGTDSGYGGGAGGGVYSLGQRRNLADDPSQSRAGILGGGSQGKMARHRPVVGGSRCHRPSPRHQSIAIIRLRPGSKSNRSGSAMALQTRHERRKTSSSIRHHPSNIPSALGRS